MAYNVVYKKSVHRDLKRLSKTEALRIIEQLEKDLSGRPEAHPVLKGQFAGLRKYRVGDYRVIYAIFEKDVLVLRIGHRRDVYK
ncbi:MAG: type II toxin-antitoxin system RelE/ParE family toxin [Candidatus Scalindua sp.]